MAYRKDSYLLRCVISDVLNEIMIFLRHEFAHRLYRLQASDAWKMLQDFERFQDRSANAQSSDRIFRFDVIGDVGKITKRLRRKTQLHVSKRRNADLICASVEMYPRRTSSKPFNPAARSICSRSKSDDANCSIACAISSWPSDGSRRTVSTAFSRNLVMTRQ